MTAGDTSRPADAAPAPVYLDYAATSPVDARVAARMVECLTREGAFGNPASSHEYGDAAGALVEAARRQVAAAVGAIPEDIVWTSGATEANNLALFGVAQYYRDTGRHIVTVRTEHKAVLDPCRELERRGWRVTYLEPDGGGVLDPAQVAAALRPDTVLVSVMHVNNEIGVIQDVAAIAGVCARHGVARLHVDAAQSVGKCPLDFAGMGIDLLSLSAHKAYGPKGVGALVVSRNHRVQLQALQFGGGQERNLRSGTVATHQVVGMGAAFELAAAAQEREAERIALLRNRLWDGLGALGGVLRNGAAECTVAHLLNVTFEGVEGESLFAAVRPAIAVSTGSACTSAVQEPSYVLRALGRDERLAESSLRFSLGRFSTEADVDMAVAAVVRAVTRLRRVAGHRIAGPPPAGHQIAGGAQSPSVSPATIADHRNTGGRTQPVAEPPAATLPGRAGRRAGMNYNDLTLRHFESAASAGTLTGRAVRRGAAGSREQGTWVQFDVQIGSNDLVETLEAVRFLAYACPYVIAVSDWIAQQAVGRQAKPALPVSVQWLRERFDVPIENLGRLLIVEDAWIAAISSPSRG
ncbi:MAG TPA: aminotransferase class V-fold PLP-dependent enzyme [Steroidobacteraceae bacterium]|nr:aminotransferase class V-fold PLP-dependent enzyme [Steroidobacteraceae bacterium]